MTAWPPSSASAVSASASGDLGAAAAGPDSRARPLPATALARRIGRCRGGPPVAAAEHLLAVAGAGQAGCRPAADAVRACRGPVVGSVDGRAARARRRPLRAAVASVDGSITDLPHTRRTPPSPAPSTLAGDGRSRRCGGGPAESGTGARPGRRSARTPPGSRRWPGTCWRPRAGDAGAADRNSCPHPGPRRAGHGATSCGGRRRPRKLNWTRVLRRRHLPGGAEAAPQGQRPPIAARVISTPCTPPGAKATAARSIPRRFSALVTHLLDAEDTALHLACSYRERWGCETANGHNNTDMGKGSPCRQQGP